MEKSTIPIPIPSFGLINIFISHFASTWEKFLSKFLSSLSKQPEFAEASNVVSAKQIKKFELSNGDTEHSLSGEDVEIVMGRLNFFCSNEEEKFCVDEILTLFEEKEPSFDEVKEAFYVFDENKDGFIDAEELKRVLCVLGLKDDELDMDQCRMMITRFDENADGKIDFNEFVKLIEISL